MRYRFTDGETKKVLDNLTILIDTREKANSHIINFLNKKKIPYKVQKLDYGDYSIMMPQGSFNGQTRDIYFTNDIVLERKFCIDEIAMNLKDKKTNINEIKQEIIDLLGKQYLEKVLKSDYNRFKQELTSINKYGITFKILIEDPNFEIIEQSVDGTDGIGVGHLGTSEAWIMTPSMDTVNAASSKINNLLNEK